MKKYVFLLTGLLLSTFLGVKAQVGTDKIPVSSDVKIGKLPNGLTYYIKYNAKPER